MDSHPLKLKVANVICICHHINIEATASCKPAWIFLAGTPGHVYYPS